VRLSRSSSWHWRSPRTGAAAQQLRSGPSLTGRGAQRHDRPPWARSRHRIDMDPRRVLHVVLPLQQVADTVVAGDATGGSRRARLAHPRRVARLGDETLQLMAAPPDVGLRPLRQEQ